jgi:hypothetical protein
VEHPVFLYRWQRCVAQQYTQNALLPFHWQQWLLESATVMFFVHSLSRCLSLFLKYLTLAAPTYIFVSYLRRRFFSVLPMWEAFEFRFIPETGFLSEGHLYSPRSICAFVCFPPRNLSFRIFPYYSPRSCISVWNKVFVLHIHSSHFHCLQNRGESQPRVAVYGSESSVSHHSGEYVCHVAIYTNNKFCKLYLVHFYYYWCKWSLCS